MTPPPAAFVLASALCFILVVTAAAQEAPPAGSLRWFESFDENRDGNLTGDEMDTAGPAEFARIDKDHSGAITIDEYLADGADDGDDEIRRTSNRFAVMDRRGDGNGTASPAEFVDFGKFVIGIADQNGNSDGVMSRQEFVDSVTPAP
jgi:Ca2+-binding EF-hand superfamily protein